jgi:chloramphenicol-sensitive protein RarD
MGVLEKNQDGDAGDASSRRARGVVVGFGCYCLWGLLPLFWALLNHVSHLEILAHRLLWSFVFLVAVCLLVRRGELFALFRQRRALLILGGAGLIITCNWGLYIFSVNSGHVLQASLGYYINPLLNILLGVFFFRERLTLAQKVATALAAAGVLYFTFDYGSFPWIALILAVSFAFYGLLKKHGGYAALPALAVETTVVVPLAIAFVAASFLIPDLAQGRAFIAPDASGLPGLASGLASGVASAPGLAAPVTAPVFVDTALLIIGGVLTALPLILFAYAANAIPYSLLGFLQYLSPTLTLLLGVFVFHEPFTHAHAVCFILIWAGLVLVAIEAIAGRRNMRHSTA